MMAKNLIEQYLVDLGEIRRTRSHVPETSFYPALQSLLSEIGKTLVPRVLCVINPANRGAGIPDGGLFSSEQFRRQAHGASDGDDLFHVQNPSRGVIEAKPPSADVLSVAASEQVGRYYKRYGMVLVTNFRAFTLVGTGLAGQPRILETFTLAASESDFWTLTAHPRKAATELGERMFEYLRRVMLLNSPLSSPQDVASILASYAHDARLRIEHAELPALSSLRQALEDALGLHFIGDKGEHFFRSTLVQTLFYGVFSAWVIWARRRRAESSSERSFAVALREGSAPWVMAGAFDWKNSSWLLRVPMLQALFMQVANPARLGALDLVEVLDWTNNVLNRINQERFFESFDEGHAVQYFYEPFLHAFDPVLRKDLGVWYTPEEIVHYQVERVDSVLRSELGLPDGLADRSVVVLDPCCGTGTYLRAVLHRIAKTLHDKGGDALVAHDLKKAALERVFGFEILPAPFVIAHLQLGLELDTLGAPLSDLTDPPERVGVYLTNALTGWEPPTDQPSQIAFPGFDEERDAAGRVKQEKPILVILGNPPYNAFSGVSPDEERGLVEPYKVGLNSLYGIKKYNLDDLYVRFFRLAEKRITEHGGRGVVSFISNFSFLGDPSFVVARRRFLDEFDKLWIDCMNGDSRETGKVTPEGKPDPSVFSTDRNREGIRVGTSISLFVKRTRKREGDTLVRFRHFWGTTKRADLLTSLDAMDFNAAYELSNPQKDNRWSFRPSDVTGTYLTWPRLTDLCDVAPSNGLMEKRGGALIDCDRGVLEARMRRYFDKNMSYDDLRIEGHPLTRDAARYPAKEARQKVLTASSYDGSHLRRYAIRPFDDRWCYYSSVRPLWNEPRPTLWRQCWTGNSFLMTRPTGVADPEGLPFCFTKALGDNDFLRGHAYYFSIRLRSGKSHPCECVSSGKLFQDRAEDNANRITANLSSASRRYLSVLNQPDPDIDQGTAESIWYHALAIGCSPAYLTENADGIRQDWPRIPLPDSRDLLIASAALGRQIAALLDTENPVPGVTTGSIAEDLRTIAVFQRVDGKPAHPDEGDLDLIAGWGHAGKGGITMPGKGKLILRNGAYDVFLNSDTCWRNVPVPVWEYTIGGYQVIKKWLSYREKPLFGRSLTPDEVRYVTEMARRLAALVALQPALDENYQATVRTTFAWSGDAGS